MGKVTLSDYKHARATVRTFNEGAARNLRQAMRANPQFAAAGVQMGIPDQFTEAEALCRSFEEDHPIKTWGNDTRLFDLQALYQEICAEMNITPARSDNDVEMDLDDDLIGVKEMLAGDLDLDDEEEHDPERWNPVFGGYTLIPVGGEIIGETSPWPRQLHDDEESYPPLGGD